MNLWKLKNNEYSLYFFNLFEESLNTAQNLNLALDTVECNDDENSEACEQYDFRFCCEKSTSETFGIGFQKFTI